MNHARFILGTGTDVGKTIVSCLLALRLDANYFKPIQSGTPTDSEFMRSILGDHRVFDETYRLTKPCSPNQAAIDDGIVIDIKKITIDDKVTKGHLIVESAGGILSPIDQELTMVDLAAHLKIPTIVVARSGLGTITHTLQTTDIVCRRGLTISSIILFGPPHARNRHDIEERSGITTIGINEIKYAHWENI